MKNRSLDFLRTLLETPSPSGFETKGQRVWLNYVTAFADEVESDAYGNCYARLNPKGSPIIFLGGHADELGLMVTHISDDGFLYFKGIGGVDVSLIRGQRVTVHGRKGPVFGVTGLLAIHLQEAEARKKVPDIHTMFIDIGARSQADAEKIVRIGDPVTYAAGFERLGPDRIAARGCDNRIGSFAAAEALRLCHEQRAKLEACVVAVSTIQEENGLYGARMAAHRVKPGVALVVDVTHATDTPISCKARDGNVRLGRGPVLGVGSANHPVVNARLERAAKKAKIPLQFEANPRRTGTDADEIFLACGGIPTVSIGVPNRYMHSPVEVIELSDLENVGKLLATFCLDVARDETFAVEI